MAGLFSQELGLKLCEMLGIKNESRAIHSISLHCVAGDLVRAEVEFYVDVEALDSLAAGYHVTGETVVERVVVTE